MSFDALFSFHRIGRARRIQQAAACAVLLLIPAAVWLLRCTPLARWYFCTFQRLTGRPCLFCGLTRSLEMCFRGHVRAAFQLHLFGPLLCAVLLASMAYLLIAAGSGYEIAWGRRIRRIFGVAVKIIVVAWVVYWVLRLLAIPPFALL